MENVEKTSKPNADLLANLEIIKGVYTAFATGDIQAFLGAMDPKIEWNEAENFPYADGNPYKGADAIVQGVFARIGADWEYWTITDQEYHVTLEAMVIVTARYNAKHKITGKVIRAQVTHMWTLKDGKITRFQQYADTLQVTNAMVS
jgi:ketosteroid isomerase-like protein